MEFQVTSYDGENIKGRILIGATIDPLVLDRRLMFFEDVDIVDRSVHACGKKDSIRYIHIDYIILMSKQDVSITVRPGYWYGATVKIPLFTKKLTGLGPDCVEAEFVARALDRREIARIPIRAVRTDKPPAPPEGGAPEAPAESKPPAPAPGAP